MDQLAAQVLLQAVDELLLGADALELRFLEDDDGFVRTTMDSSAWIAEATWRVSSTFEVMQPVPSTATATTPASALQGPCPARNVRDELRCGVMRSSVSRRARVYVNATGANG